MPEVLLDEHRLEYLAVGPLLAILHIVEFRIEIFLNNNASFCEENRSRRDTLRAKREMSRRGQRECDLLQICDASHACSRKTRYFSDDKMINY